MLSVLSVFYFTCIFMHTGKGGYGSREKVPKEISGGWHGQMREWREGRLYVFLNDVEPEPTLRGRLKGGNSTWA